MPLCAAIEPKIYKKERPRGLDTFQASQSLHGSHGGGKDNIGRWGNWKRRGKVTSRFDTRLLPSPFDPRYNAHLIPRFSFISPCGSCSVIVPYSRLPILLCLILTH